LTATKFAHIAPVVRYGAGRRIIDGGEGSNFGGAFGIRTSPAEPAPAQVQEAQRPEQAQPEAASPRNAAPPAAQQEQPQRRQQQPERAQLRQAVDEDTEVVEAERQPGQGREDLPSDAQPIEDEQPQPAPAAPAPAPQQPQPPQGQDNGRGLTITPDMPLALQNRLLELLTAKGGTVTEILNKDGSPADSASVLQVSIGQCSGNWKILDSFSWLLLGCRCTW